MHRFSNCDIDDNSVLLFQRTITTSHFEIQLLKNEKLECEWKLSEQGYLRVSSPSCLL